MSTGKSLVEYLADGPRFDTSTARRAIIEGRVKVNGEIVEDPAFRLSFEEGFILDVDTKTTPTTTKESA